MEADFRLILTGHVPLTVIVPAARIYRVYYPQAATDPAIRITKVTGQVGLTMQGSDGLTLSTMQVDVRTRADAGSAQLVSIRNALLALLHPFVGVKGSTYFHLVGLADDRGEDFEKPATIEYLTASMDFNVWSRAA